MPLSYSGWLPHPVPSSKQTDADDTFGNLLDMHVPATTFVPGLPSTFSPFDPHLQPVDQVVTFGPSFTRQTNAYFAQSQTPSHICEPDGFDLLLKHGDPFLGDEIQFAGLLPPDAVSARATLAGSDAAPETYFDMCTQRTQKRSDSIGITAEGGELEGKPTSRRTTRTPAERAEATLAKNRRAQKRFREKSKQRAQDLEATLTSLRNQVERLNIQNSDLTKRNSMLESIVSLRDEQIQQLQKDQQVFKFGTGAAQLRLPSVPSLLMSVEQAEHGSKQLMLLRSFDDVSREYRGHVSQIIRLLTEHDAADTCHRQGLATHIADLAAAIGQFCMTEAIKHPINAKKLLADDAQESRPAFAWEDLMDQLQLSVEQCGKIVQLRCMFLSRAQQLLVERRKLTAELHLACQATLEGNELRSMARDVVETHRIAQDLNNSFTQEHMAVLDFATMLYSHILDPMALARVVVHSYPVFPDALALSTAIASWYARASTSVDTV